MSNRLTTHHLDALVLAGGQSKRIGVPKALLPWKETTLIATLTPLFRRVLVIARDSKELAGLGVEVLADTQPARGPLVGLVTGLAASDTPWCFVVGCDMPLLQPDVIGRMAENLEGCDILVPSLEGRLQPLHAFYSRECLPRAVDLLSHGITAPHDLFSRCQLRTMPAADFMDIDPELLSSKDIDTRDDYRVAQGLTRDSSGSG